MKAPEVTIITCIAVMSLAFTSIPLNFQSTTGNPAENEKSNQAVNNQVVS